MAASVYLSQPQVTIAGTDFTAQCSAVSMELGYDSLEITSFADSGHLMAPGLQTVSGSITLYVSYGATEVEGKIADALGDGTTTIVVKKASGAVAANNPEWTISNTMISTEPLVWNYGEIQVMELSFEGGTWVRDVTP